MKREKRHGIERELSIKRIRSQKKYSILIVSVLLLTCTLIQIGFQMSEGLKAAYIENRKAVYGEWEQVFLDMDESSVKVAEENPFLAQTGKISIYGAIAGDYLENRQMIITLADSAVSTKADLAGKTIAVQKESSALEAVSADTALTSTLKNGAPEEFDTNIDCFMDLEAGRSQAIVVDEVLARYVMKQRGQEKYKVLDENFGTEQYAVGMRKQDTTLLEKINEAMKACNEDGTTAALNAKWFGE